MLCLLCTILERSVMIYSIETRLFLGLSNSRVLSSRITVPSCPHVEQLKVFLFKGLGLCSLQAWRDKSLS